MYSRAQTWCLHNQQFLSKRNNPISVLLLREGSLKWFSPLLDLLDLHYLSVWLAHKIPALTECLCSPQIPVEILNPKMTVLGSKAFGRSWVELSWTGLVPLWKRPQSAPLPFLPRVGTSKKMTTMNQSSTMLAPWSQTSGLQNCEK